MESYTQITLDEWTNWKEDIRKKLQEIAGNFVYIGYRLKQIRESGMFDGAADIFEFAQKEYGLGKSTVSRFIAINEKYSEGGNSLELKEEYKNFSSSKLSEMLTLSDSECELITEKTTIKDIRELKRFQQQDVPEIKETPESKETPEDIGNGPTVQRTPLETCMIDYFSKNKEQLEKVLQLLNRETPDYKEAAELLNPSGQSSHKKGIVFLFFYDWNRGVKYKLLTAPQPISMTWSEYLNEVYKIYGEFDQENVWNAFYGEEVEEIQIEKEPKKEPENQPQENTAQAKENQGLQPSVATSQRVEKAPDNVEEKEEEIKENKSIILAVLETEKQEQPLENITEIAEIVEKEELQVEGQRNIEDYPEYLPKDYREEGAGEENQPKEVVEDTQSDTICKLIQTEIGKLINNVNAKRWNQAIMDVEEITYKLQKAKEMEELEMEELESE